jgi:hypothetical protein
MPKQIISKSDQLATKVPEAGARQTLAETVARPGEESVSVNQTTGSRNLETAQPPQVQERLLTLIAGVGHQCEEVERQFAKNPVPELEALIKRHRVLALQLSTAGHGNPALLKLSDQLTRTVLAFINAQTKAGFAERGMSLKEAQAAEARKDAETKALELCLEDARPHPEVRELFKGVFNALRKVRTGRANNK